MTQGMCGRFRRNFRNGVRRSGELLTALPPAMPVAELKHWQGGDPLMKSGRMRSMSARTVASSPQSIWMKWARRRVPGGSAPGSTG